MTFNNETRKPKGNISSLVSCTVPSLATFEQRRQQVWSGQYLYKTSNLTLTFDHISLKSIGYICFVGATTVPSLATFKQRGQMILSGYRLVYRPIDRQVQNRWGYKNGFSMDCNWYPVYLFLECFVFSCKNYMISVIFVLSCCITCIT